MMDVAIGLFLIAHGLIHVAIYATPPPQDGSAPFDPSHSWALAGAHVAESSTRSLSVLVAWVSGIVLAVAGVALLAGSAVWIPIAVIGAASGLFLKVLFFNAWLSAGILIDLGILWAVAAGWPPSLM
jgi:hypothetical protein